ncbi:MAG: hypothetical protein ACTSWY_14230 [Promethearchaeota archaeon]
MQTFPRKAKNNNIPPYYLCLLDEDDEFDEFDEAKHNGEKKV